MAMVSVRAHGNGNGGGSNPSSRVVYAAILAAVAITTIYILSLPSEGGGDKVAQGSSTATSEEVSPRTALHQGMMAGSKNK